MVEDELDSFGSLLNNESIDPDRNYYDWVIKVSKYFNKVDFTMECNKVFISPKKSLSVLYINKRSLKKNIDNFLVYLESLSHIFDAIAFL